VEPPSSDGTKTALGPRSAAKVSDSSDARFGIGVIIVIIGGAVGGVFFLRTEARRFFRRRERAAF
jgi:hypothetical protein